jgi:hypothetical protein
MLTLYGAFTRVDGEAVGNSRGLKSLNDAPIGSADTTQKDAIGCSRVSYLVGGRQAAA